MEDKKTFRKLYGRHHQLINCYRLSVSQMITDMFLLSSTKSGPSTLFFTYLWISTCVNVSNPTYDTGTWIAYPSGAPEFNSGVYFGSCCSIHSYFVLLTIVSLFVLFFQCFLCFDLRLLINLLVSSNHSLINPQQRGSYWIIRKSINSPLDTQWVYSTMSVQNFTGQNIYFHSRSTRIKYN